MTPAERSRRATAAFLNIRAAVARVAAIIADAESSYRENEGGYPQTGQASASAATWTTEPIGRLPVDETHARTAAGWAWQ